MDGVRKMVSGPTRHGPMIRLLGNAIIHRQVVLCRYICTKVTRQLSRFFSFLCIAIFVSEEKSS